MSSGLTLAIIGCGNMGSAILSGVLDAIRQEKKSGRDKNDSSEQNTPFSHIIACTKSRSSADKLREQYADHSSLLDFQHGDNLPAITQADVIMLGCKPYLVKSVLEAEGVSEALAGKFVISIIAGKTLEVLSEHIASGLSESPDKTKPKAKTFVARAIPTIACRVRQSMTVIELPQDCPSSYTKVIEWIFSQIGQVKVLDAEIFDVGTMLMASLASVSVAFDGLLDGCVAKGLQRADASEMASQCLLGLSLLLKSGMHPAILRENISSPRGCTIQGLLTVEKAAVRSAFAESIINGTKHLQDLQKKDP